MQQPWRRAGRGRGNQRAITRGLTRRARCFPASLSTATLPAIPSCAPPSGDVTFSTNFFLKIGSEVTIRIENNPTGTLAHILSVDGQPPEVAETLSAFAQAQDVIVGQNSPQAASAAEQPSLPASAVTVTGTLISTPQANATLPVGTQLTLKVTALNIASSNVPEELLASAPQTAPAAATSPASYTAYARAAGAPAIPAPPSPTVTAQPAAPAAPAVALTPSTLSAPPAQTLATPAGQTIAATVIGNEPGGEAVVQTPLGVVRLQAGTVLPTGSRITFELVQATPPQGCHKSGYHYYARAHHRAGATLDVAAADCRAAG